MKSYSLFYGQGFHAVINSKISIQFERLRLKKIYCPYF